MPIRGSEKATRLRKSWAAPFRERVLPLIDEEAFRDAFSSTRGRPNKSSRLLVALHLLKEWNDLTDEQVIDNLEYNLQWHFALGIEDEENPYQLITGVAVNGANESDQNAVLPMLDQLEERGMAPDEMLADTGYGSGENIVESAQRGVDLHAPVPDPDKAQPVDHFQRPVSDKSWTDTDSSKPASPSHPRADSSKPLELAWFSFDKTCCLVFSCPAGHPAIDQYLSKTNQLIARFSAETCTNCPLAAICPTGLDLGVVDTWLTASDTHPGGEKPA